MIDWIVPLSDLRFSEEEIEAVAGVYRSGWLTAGPLVERFEQELARFVGARHGVACGSGTAALELIWAGLGLAPGDEVVMPSLTFAATAASVIRSGAVPVFADIGSPHQPWPSAAAAAEVIGERTRAIAMVAYGGHLGTTTQIREVAQRAGVALVEDAAHALGARSQGRAAGTLGVAGAFSFFSNKNLAIGEGGMLVTDDEELAARARLLRSHGLSADTWQRHGTSGGTYDVLAAGFNHRLDEPRAALGSLRLARLDDAGASRRSLAATYTRELSGIAGVEPVLAEDQPGECAWHLYPVLLAPELDRDRFRQDLASAGVQTSFHYPPLHLTSAFRTGVRLPATEEYARRTVTLPLFDGMTADQQSHTLAAIARAASAV